jgi:hypothetical protein
VALLTETAEVLFAPGLGASEEKIQSAVEGGGGYTCKHTRTDVAHAGKGGRFSGEVREGGGGGGRGGGQCLVIKLSSLLVRARTNF